MDPELRLEAALEFTEHVGLICLFQLLLAGNEKPGLALESLP